KAFWQPDSQRLMKMHLFDQHSPTPETLAQVGRRYFASHSASELIAIRARNLAYPFEPGYLIDELRHASSSQWSDALNDGWLFSVRKLFGALDIFVAAALLVAGWRLRHRWRDVDRHRADGIKWAAAIAVASFVMPLIAFGGDQGTENIRWVY